MKHGCIDKGGNVEDSPGVAGWAPVENNDWYDTDKDGEDDGGPLLAGNDKLEVDVPEAP